MQVKVLTLRPVCFGNRIGALIRKEFAQIAGTGVWRSRWLFRPPLQLLLFGFALNATVSQPAAGSCRRKQDAGEP